MPFFSTRILTVVFVLSYMAAAARAQIPGAPQTAATDSKPLPAAQDPLNRLTPQSSVLSFLETCRGKNYSRASKYLDLSGLAPELRLRGAPDLAEQMCDVLDRDAQFDVAALSRDPNGDEEDNLPLKEELVSSFKNKEELVEVKLERIQLRTGLSIWVFSSASVSAIPKLLQLTSDSAIAPYLPPLLVVLRFVATPLWKWIALFLLAAVSFAIARAVSRLALVIMQFVLKRLMPRTNATPIHLLISPVQVLVTVALFRAGVEGIAPSAILRLYLGRGIVLVLMMGLAWLFARLAEVAASRIQTALIARHSTFSRSGLPLAVRVVKIAIVAFAITAILSNWGYNTNTIWAGVGIGGVAVALAAQKTIENLFGGVAVISDRPVVVGDFCKFGDRVGTVEDIGLRSTRIRTLDRTLVTVPNGEFSSMVLENFSRRDKMLFHPILNLRRNTTPDQVRQILQSIRAILKTRPDAESGELPVRFIGVGEYSLDLEVFAYILTPDFDQFLKIQQELHLQILDAIAAAGTSLALPTQVSYIDSPPMRSKPAIEPAPTGARE